MTVLDELLNPDFRDLLKTFSEDGVEFLIVGAYANAHLEGRTVPFIGRDALVRNKQAAGRPKDLADVARLKR